MPRNSSSLPIQLGRILIKRAEAVATATDEDVTNELIVEQMGRLVQRLANADVQKAVCAAAIDEYNREPTPRKSRTAKA